MEKDSISIKFKKDIPSYIEDPIDIVSLEMTEFFFNGLL